MSRKINRSFLGFCVSGASFIFILLCLLAHASEVASVWSEPNKFNAQYDAGSRRDPFIQPAKGRFENITANVDIENLKLTGMVEGEDHKIAIFVSQTGPEFGFLLKSGKLYRENHQIITEITGMIISDTEVILKQMGKEIRYRLR